MADKPKSSTERVCQALASFGLDNRVIELTQTTRTAQDAAKAVGCEVGQIAKSLVFKGEKSGRPYLVIASGKNRVNERKIAAVVSEPVKMGDPDFVRQTTGFAIGGVAPLGHTSPLTILIDQDLENYEVIWAAAGTPRTVFELTPNQLTAMTGGRVIPIR